MVISEVSTTGENSDGLGTNSRKNKVRTLSALMGIYFWFGESGKKIISPKLRCTKTRLKHQQDVSAVIRC